MIITISGTPGSGKSVVGRALAKKMKYKFYGAGDMRRKYAMQNGMTLEELNKKAEKNPASDFMVDEYMKKMGSTEDNFVIVGRMAFKMINHSVKIFLDADVDVRAKRVFGANREEEQFKTLFDAKKSIQMRMNTDVKRYERLYKFNPFDLKNFDLVVDSTNIGIDEVVNQIYRFAKSKSTLTK